MKKITDALNRIDEKKKKIDAVLPLPIVLEKNLQEWLAMYFTYTSNALAGNTLSHSETAIVVEKGIAIGDKTVREHIELIDHARAINCIIKLGYKKRSDLTLDDILTIHKIVSEKTDNFLITAEFMQWLHSVQDHPVIVAALAHYKLVTIHPFVDGNGRTARLLMNLLLLQQGYPLAIIKKEKRPAYIDAIEHARQTDDFIPFYEVIIVAVEYSLDIYLESIEQSDLS